MKSRIILVNNKIKTDMFGFMMIEIILAFSLFSLFTISYFTLNLSMQSLKIWSIKELNLLKNSVFQLDNFIKNENINKNFNQINYGNYSKLINLNDLSIVKSNFVDSWGSSNCLSRINFDLSKIQYYSNGVFLGTGNISTNIEVRNSVIYLTTDSNVQSQSDFFIIDSTDFISPIIISSLNTGPGLSSIAVAGPYVYAANTGSISQLQIIDIHDRKNPFLISQLKVPFPEASSTPPKANSIFYKDSFIYLGTSKWDGPEFYIIDISNPMIPKIVGNFETNTLINDIYIYENIAYLATSDNLQMRILDISNKSQPILTDSFSPSGWQTQGGKAIDFFEGKLALGRTVGGFNNISNHEGFIFSTSTNLNNFISHDILGGIYDFLIRSSHIFLATHSPSAEFQIWDSTFSTKIFEKKLGFQPLSFSCDWSNIFFTTGNDMGFAILKL